MNSSLDCGYIRNRYWRDGACQLKRTFFCSIPVTTAEPSVIPSESPSSNPTLNPTKNPTTIDPTPSPTSYPTQSPTVVPSEYPSYNPTIAPSATKDPTSEPTFFPTETPLPLTRSPVTNEPTTIPSAQPTLNPAPRPSEQLTINLTPSATNGNEGSVGHQDTTAQSNVQDDVEKTEEQSDSQEWVYIVSAVLVICCLIGVLIMFFKKRKYIKPKQVHNVSEIVHSVSGPSSELMTDIDNGSASLEMRHNKSIEDMDDDGVITPNMITPMIPPDDDNQTNIYQVHQNDAEEGMLSECDDDDDDDDEGDILTAVNTMNIEKVNGVNEDCDVDDIVLEMQTNQGPIHVNLAEDEFIIDDETNNYGSTKQ